MEILKDYRLNVLKGAIVPVYLLVPFQNGLLREIRLPWMDEKKRNSAINYYLQHEIPGLTSELIYTYHVIEEPENKYLTVKVLVARKDSIDFYITSMEKAGYKVRGIEYSISALAEMFSDLPTTTRVLYLQNVRGKRIQMVLFKDTKPEVVAEVAFEQLDITKYQIYLGLKDHDIPIDFIVTDHSEQTDMLASLLLNAGLVKDKLLSFNKKILDQKIAWEQGTSDFSSYPLLAELYRVKENKNLNFFPRHHRLNKVRVLLLSLVCVLATFLLLISTIWHPKYDDLKRFEHELAILQSYHVDLSDDEVNIALTDWQAKQKSRVIALERILYVLENLKNEIKLNRLSLNNNTMHLWAECESEIAITKTIEELVENGWKNPTLIDYYYDNQKLVFSLSVEGCW
ncbi:MAG: hypothetical protein GX351_03610 [Peptococcaceae bacterium]|nr:hypothetical protein [Peptococcaceae bacterium]